MVLMLKMCGVEEYARGRINHPGESVEKVEIDNWTFNDTYARVLIANNITASQMVHISGCTTAYTAWSNLEAVHK